MRLLRFFDYRFVLAFGALMIVGTVCWDSFVNGRESEAKTVQIDHLIESNDRDQRTAARQRQLLLEGQQDLQRKYDELVEANQQMADLLTARGIPLPNSVTRIERSSSSNDDNDDNDDEGDTIIVRPPSTSNPTPRPTRPGDDDDDDGETVPDVDDLTDMTDDIVDDLLNSVPEQ